MVEQIKNLNNSNCKPFLRWAGGKRWLLKELYRFLPKNEFNRYHEPFIGGASIFFYLQPKYSFISDSNLELIETYCAVKDDVDFVIENLKKFKNNKEEYYKIRRSEYKSLYKRAAKFIYLNQTSFNGIYRVNSNGQYNVPYGYRDKYKFNYDNLKNVSKLLQSVDIVNQDFSKIINNVKQGDLIFMDPPYTVAHNNNGFIEYNKKIFSLDDQKRLSNMIGQIKELGAYYIMTNANHNSLRKIFSEHKDIIIEIERNSLIGGIGAKRGKFSEIIMTNRI